MQKSHAEIERKFLVTNPKFPVLGSFRIRQAYLYFSSSCNARIRSTEHGEDYSTTLTLKGAIGLSRPEYECELESSFFDLFWNEQTLQKIEKRRDHVLLSGVNGVEVRGFLDRFEQELEGLNILEIEFDSVQDANMFSKEAFEFRYELTLNPYFSNSFLSTLRSDEMLEMQLIRNLKNAQLSAYRSALIILTYYCPKLISEISRIRSLKIEDLLSLLDYVEQLPYGLEGVSNEYFPRKEVYERFRL